MSRYGAVGAIIAIPVAVVVGLFSSPDPGSSIEAPVCVEDMDCWDCSSMGNLVCGPDVDYPLEGIESDTTT